MTSSVSAASAPRQALAYFQAEILSAGRSHIGIFVQGYECNYETAWPECPIEMAFAALMIHQEDRARGKRNHAAVACLHLPISSEDDQELLVRR